MNKKVKKSSPAIVKGGFLLKFVQKDSDSVTGGFRIAIQDDSGELVAVPFLVGMPIFAEGQEVRSREIPVGIPVPDHDRTGGFRDDFRDDEISVL